MGRYNNSAPYYAQGVALFHGNGDWTFTYVDLFLGGQGLERSVIAAPNVSMSAKNQEPVAAIQPADGQVEAGSPVTFDGSTSHDEDGQIASYVWIFGDGQTSSQASVEHIYYTAGTYDVELTVTDDKGAMNTTKTQITVKAIPVGVSFTPQTLNVKDHGRFVEARLQLPAQYCKLGIDASSVHLSDGETSVSAVSVRRQTVIFDRQAVINFIESTSGATALPVCGKVNLEGGAADFEGSGTIRIIDPGKGKHHGQSHRWHNKKVGEIGHDLHGRNDSHDQHNPGKGKK